MLACFVFSTGGHPISDSVRLRSGGDYRICAPRHYRIAYDSGGG